MSMFYDTKGKALVFDEETQLVFDGIDAMLEKPYTDEIQ